MSMIYEGTLAASAARTAAAQFEPAGGSSLANCPAPRVLEVVIDTTAATTGSVVATLQAYDEAKGGWVNLLASAAITATGTVTLRYGLDAPIVTNASAFGIVPKRWRVDTTSNGTAQTFSISGRVFC